MSRPVAWCLQHVPFEGPARLEQVLGGRGYDVRVVPVFRGEALPDPARDDVVVLTGGPMSVNDRHLSWMGPEIRWTRVQVERGTRLLGICLGSQILARALDATVDPNAHREIGWFGLHATADTEIARQLARPAAVLHWHGERWELPDGATLLAGSGACDHQAFAFADHVLALQMHLEMTPASAAALCDACEEDLAPGPWVQSRERIVEARADFEAAWTALDPIVERWLAREVGA